MNEKREEKTYTILLMFVNLFIYCISAAPIYLNYRIGGQSIYLYMSVSASSLMVIGVALAVITPLRRLFYKIDKPEVRGEFRVNIAFSMFLTLINCIILVLLLLNAVQLPESDMERQKIPSGTKTPVTLSSANPGFSVRPAIKSAPYTGPGNETPGAGEPSPSPPPGESEGIPFERGADSTDVLGAREPMILPQKALERIERYPLESAQKEVLKRTLTFFSTCSEKELNSLTGLMIHWGSSPTEDVFSPIAFTGEKVYFELLVFHKRPSGPPGIYRP